MRTKKIGVIGKGFVGTAVARGFVNFAEVKIYDVDKNKSSHSLEEVANSEFVFLCLPTPMISAEGGRANLRIIEGCLKDINNLENRNKDTIYIIKSTVPIGKTKEWSKQYLDLNIVHSPEFLTARSAIIDFICPSRSIVGCEDMEVGEKVQRLLEDRFPGVVCFLMTSEESETVKYMANCFFATKVSFFNEMKLFIDKKGLSWDDVLAGVISDGRIGKSHYEVPGHDGDGGYGGTCFPKDINSFIHVMEDNGIDPLLLKASWEQNKRVRKNWDWATNSSAVLEDEED
jgi:nucleotide sugar dehydrogenase